jgi:putative flippase GtrA
VLNKHFIAEVCRFGIVGGIGFVVNYGVLSLLSSHYRLDHVTSEVIAMLIALQVTFVLHDIWTYREHKRRHDYSHRLRVRYGSYLLSNTAGSAMTIVGYAVLYHYLHSFFALALAAVVGMLWNFCINRFVIWKHHGIQPTGTSSEQA